MKLKNKFDLIIFDWDGTLINSIDWIVHCLKTAGNTAGYITPDEQALKNTIGLSIEAAMNQLYLGIDNKTQDQLVSLYNAEYFSKIITEADLFTGIKDMLNGLKQQGYLLAIATGKKRIGLDKAMQETGLANFFDMTCCADQTASKPKPDMLEKIIDYLHISKEKTVMVGDSIHDIQMANNAKIASIAVSCGANTADQLRSYHPILNLKNTIELQEIL